MPKPYTEPSDTAKRLPLDGLQSGGVRGTAIVGSDDAARQRSEANVSASNSPVIGLPGQRATPPITNGVVGSIPGIQRGYAAGLGFANRQNVLTWQRNPADRPCQDLVRAGFLPGAGMCGRRR